MRQLGLSQQEVLRALLTHGYWAHGGWIWGTLGETKRILDSLVKRGLVYVDANGFYRARPLVASKAQTQEENNDPE